MDKNILHLILILLIISILFKINYESFTTSLIDFINITNNIAKNNAICFITRTLDPKILEFAESCTEYNDVYIVVDDNNQEIVQDSTSNVKIIRLDNSECSNNNYIRSTSRFNLDVTGWDKALYYFCKKNKIYDNVWFIEDDVFIPRSNTLYNLDLLYPSEDLLAKDMSNITNNKSSNQNWLDKIQGFKNLTNYNSGSLTNDSGSLTNNSGSLTNNSGSLTNYSGSLTNDSGSLTNYYSGSLTNNNVPVYWSWVCAMRCSKKLLKLVNEFSINYKQLYFHEMMIPSLVKNNNLSYSKILELKNIVYRKEYDDEDIISNPSLLYHPIKDYERQEKLRIKIKNSKDF
jgi:hypothetical protein